MKIDTFVIGCGTCKRKKGEEMKDLMALQQFPMLPVILMNISIDFIVVLPKSSSKSIIIVIVDQISKYAHFHALQHSFTPITIAKKITDQIFNLVGRQTSIVFDRDPTFTNKFL